MRIDAIVINASPLITLFRSGQADLLPRLFTHIVVPEAVWKEVVLDEWEDAAALQLSKQSWPVRAVVECSPRVAAGTGRWGDGGLEPCSCQSAAARGDRRHGCASLRKDVEYSHPGHWRTAGARQASRIIDFRGRRDRKAS